MSIFTFSVSRKSSEVSFTKMQARKSLLVIVLYHRLDLLPDPLQHSRVSEIDFFLKMQPKLPCYRTGSGRCEEVQGCWC
jgi:hypothetical protein